jgi:hypothetical protein
LRFLLFAPATASAQAHACAHLSKRDRLKPVFAPHHSPTSLTSVSSITPVAC